MIVDSPLPRDYRLHCKLFTDEKLAEQFHRHTAGAAAGCKTSKACLAVVRQELLRRVPTDPRYAELRKRRAERRAKLRQT
mgnify:CR=1 FL=1